MAENTLTNKQQRQQEAQEMLGFVQQMQNSDNPKIAAAALRIMADAQKRMDKVGLKAGDIGEMHFHTEALRVALDAHNPETQPEPESPQGVEAQLLRNAYKEATDKGEKFEFQPSEKDVDAPAPTTDKEKRSAEAQEMLDFVKQMQNSDNPEVAAAAQRIMADAQKRMDKAGIQLGEDSINYYQIEALKVTLGFHNPDLTEEPDNQQGLDAKLLRDGFKTYSENKQTEQEQEQEQEQPAPEQEQPAPEQEQPAPEQVGSIAFTGPENDTTRTPERSDDLLQQVLDTQLKLRYQSTEANLEGTKLFDPFNQIKNVEDCRGEVPPYVKAELSSGARLYNRPDKIDMFYDTYTNKDGEKSSSLQFEDCMAMVRMGQEKGWTATTLSGPKEFQEQMYLACRAMGLEVRDYTPSKELREKGDALAEQHASTREHSKSVDDRFPQLEDKRVAENRDVSDIDKDFALSSRAENLGFEPKVEQDKKAPERAPAPAEKNEEKAETAPTKTEKVEEKQPDVVEKPKEKESLQSGLQKTSTETKSKGAERKEKVEQLASSSINDLKSLDAGKATEAQKMLGSAKSPSETLKVVGDVKTETKGITAKKAAKEKDKENSANIQKAVVDKALSSNVK